METLFFDGTIIDGKGRLLEHGAVFIQDASIADVGAHADLERRWASRADLIVDLAGRTLMPGLIDTHVHLAGGDFVPHREHESIGLAALRTAEAARRTLHAGITTIRVSGSRDFLDVDLRDAIQAGLTDGPRVIASGRGITTTGGHYHNWCAMEADGVDGVRRAVREHIKRGADSIKLMLSPGVATEGSDVNSEQFTLEEVEAAVYEAHKVGRPVQSHAIGAGGIRNGVRAGVDSIDHGHYLDEEQAQLMKKKGIYFVPTFAPTHYYIVQRLAEPWRIARAEAAEPRHDAAFRLALEIGVPIAMGCDCGAQSRMPNGKNALELALMVHHGMPPMDVLVAATREAANLLRILPQVGTLEPGKAADLIVVDGNPVDDITCLQDRVRAVVKGGAVRRDDLGLIETRSRAVAMA